MAIVDSLLDFSPAAAITSATTTASADYIDLGPLASGNTSRDIGTGQDVYLVVQLTAGSVTTVTSPTLTVNVQVDDNTGFSSATQVATSGAVNLPTTAGTLAGNDLKNLIVMRLPKADYERYLRLSFVTGGTITTASYTFKAFLTLDADAWRAYADAITIS